MFCFHWITRGNFEFRYRCGDRSVPVTPFIGQIMGFGGNFAIQGWATCEGQLLAISSNSALFSILGTTYGGDGRTTFGLPDLRGRAAIHAGTGPGLPHVSLGQKAGSQTVTLTQTTLPSHTHATTSTPQAAVNATTDEGNLEVPGPANRLCHGRLSMGGIDISYFRQGATDTTLGGLTVLRVFKRSG